jgi:hypothetical protein
VELATTLDKNMNRSWISSNIRSAACKCRNLIKATLAQRREAKEYTRNLKRMKAEKEVAIAKSLEYQEQQLAERARLLNRIHLEESNNPLRVCPISHVQAARA